MDDAPPHPKRNATSWVPGVSGNPKGRRGRATSLIDAIRDKVDTQELVDTALELMRTGTGNEKLQALNWLRDSGFVRPAERHELGTPGSTDAADDDLPDTLTLDELRELDALDQRRAAIVADGVSRDRHTDAVSSTHSVLQLTSARPSIRPSDGVTEDDPE